jgi:hypothetical protein
MVELPIVPREQVKGEYYCYGWITYPNLGDSEKMDTFQTEGFAMGR